MIQMTQRQAIRFGDYIRRFGEIYDEGVTIEQDWDGTLTFQSGGAHWRIRPDGTNPPQEETAQ